MKGERLPFGFHAVTPEQDASLNSPEDNEPTDEQLRKLLEQMSGDRDLGKYVVPDHDTDAQD